MEENPLFVRSPSHGYVISSIGVAVAMGVKVVIMAELLGANEGVGAQIADARAMLDTSTVMAYVLLVIVFVSLFEYLITNHWKSYLCRGEDNAEFKKCAF